ncbi:putative uncharacterized protein [Carnobacterium maltaromaticum LMA28]|uniref:Uncharacterized protein n=1 Tax=Carnobacterium maltaromaticum LMA28 TaxID=1234679 RepID=K8E5U1_CARML|nr:hypothetical protein [Carnobacterium maltaromaticum]CCO12069.2 putative uncharacterized protein [Carnobacterium maltaromaticum LMA28]
MSKPFMLTYDLNSPGQSYDDVIKTIKEDISTGVWCSYWKSSYLLRSNLTPHQMIAKLKPFLDNGDRFFITEIVDNKGGWLTDKNWDYINKNIFTD